MYYPPLCHSPGGSMICHQVNTHVHQGDQNLTTLFLVEKFWQKWRRCMSNVKCYLNQGGSLCWAGMKKCSRGLSIFQISPSGLVLLEGKLLLRPAAESFRKPTRWDSPGLWHRGGTILVPRPSIGSGHSPFWRPWNKRTKIKWNISLGRFDSPQYHWLCMLPRI